VKLDHTIDSQAEDEIDPGPRDTMRDADGSAKIALIRDGFVANWCHGERPPFLGAQWEPERKRR